LAAKVKGMSNPEGYANFLAKSSEVALHQAEAQHYMTANRTADEELRQGKPYWDVQASRAKAESEVQTAKSLVAYRQTLEEEQRMKAARAQVEAKATATYSDPMSSPADKAQAFNLLNPGFIPKMSTDNNGVTSLVNPGDPDPYQQKFPELGGGLYPTRTLGPEIAKDPDWKAGRIYSIKTPQGIMWTSDELKGSNGKPMVSRDFRDVQVGLHPDLGRRAAVPRGADMPTAPARPAPGSRQMYALPQPKSEAPSYGDPEDLAAIEAAKVKPGTLLGPYAD
jgi:hypothetical protein